MKTITIIFVLLAIILVTIVNRIVFLRTKSENLEDNANFSFIVPLNLGLLVAFIKPLILLDTYTDFNYLNFGLSIETITKAFSLISISTISLIISGVLAFIVYFIVTKRSLIRESDKNLLLFGSIIFLVFSALNYFVFSDVFDATIVLPTDLNIR